MYDTAVKSQNKVKLTEQSKDIGILDFYESLSLLPKLVATIQHVCKELYEVHRPDNGFISATQDLVTMQFLLAELKAVRAESRGALVAQSADLEQVQDESIIGNSDKM